MPQRAPVRFPLLASAHVLYDLRHPAAAVRDATREGRRPTPERTRTAFAAYRWPRATNDGQFARDAHWANRRSRVRATRELTALRQVVAAAARGGRSLVDAELDDLDPTPPPRRSAGW